ncbi:CD59 glycoprotein [Colossoma macropomum]|uniref:CD59 glycoprotein n=1 Tax=Colossoma macropomum TaxID=42526 RepID=UPI001864B934|nr:CD59 glycoprotein [Colossoma macropomum]XP_036439907.1 CD59 glycoprotein [Colossoma macropomum]
MKGFVGVSVVFGIALLGLGSAIKCYKCRDYTGSCTKTQDCRFEDSCLTLNERGGETYRQCVRHSDCDYNLLSQMFPQVSSFTFKCCSSDLCNGASTTTISSSVLGLLVSLAVWWWCVL